MSPIIKQTISASQATLELFPADDLDRLDWLIDRLALIDPDSWQTDVVRSTCVAPDFVTHIRGLIRQHPPDLRVTVGGSDHDRAEGRCTRCHPVLSFHYEATVENPLVCDERACECWLFIG